MDEVEEVEETVTEPTKAPPTPVRYRAIDSQLTSHVVLDVSEEVDTEDHYSDEEEDNEPTV